MAKEGGMGMTVKLDSSDGVVRNISNDILNLGIKTPRGVQDITGIDKSGMERLLLLADGEIAMSGVFNDEALQSDPTNSGSHLVLKDASSSSVVRTLTLVVSGQTLALEVVLPDYELTRGSDGSFTWAVTAQLANGAVPTWSP